MKNKDLTTTEVLVVDDSLDSIIFLQEFLTDGGYECRLATSGVMALDLLAQEKIDFRLPSQPSTA